MVGKSNFKKHIFLASVFSVWGSELRYFREPIKLAVATLKDTDRE